MKKFFKVLREAIIADTSHYKGKLIKEVYAKHGKRLDADMKRFVESRILLTRRSEIHKTYLGTHHNRVQEKRWNTLFHVAVCMECGERLKFISLTKPSTRQFCSPFCSNRNDNKKKVTEDSCMEKYGVPHVTMLDSVKNKVKATNMKRHGTTCSLQSPQVVKKTKKTNLEKYGTEHHFSSSLMKDRLREISIERYGTDNPRQNKEVQRKYRETMLRKYGEDNPLKVHEIKLKVQETNFERYGGPAPLCSEAVKKIAKKTSIERYGTDYPMQSPEVFERQQKAAFKTKSLRFRGIKFNGLQGYEPQAIKHLVRELGIAPRDITTGISNMKTFKYKLNGSKKVYIPDMIIEHEDPIFVEVKSSYTFSYDKPRLSAKCKAVVKSGYRMMVLVMSGNGACLKHYGALKPKTLPGD
jgi:hypothetical protein